MKFKMTEIATIRIEFKDEEFSEYELSNSAYDKMATALDKDKSVKDWQMIGNAYSIEATNKATILKMKKLYTQLTKNKSKDEVVTIEWGYWIDD